MEPNAALDDKLDAANLLGFKALATIMAGTDDMADRMVAVQFLVCNAIINLGLADNSWEEVVDQLSFNVKAMMRSLVLARHEGTLQ